MQKQSRLPPSLPPRGLSRDQAAEYICASPALFDQLVRDGRMPKPVRINTKPVWDRVEIDLYFSALKSEEAAIADDPWSDFDRAA
ncbi:hypothetical protein T281_18010 [Rhodomicrobium udaipurense JA643]|uniref:Uncharacterized protein n=1 Tax=Rhodomicrobium udaipurense TaxID=1202716 RepID=A0A8I1GG26_9HYPH|nr:hypothetical protein [Rhodomicrobium udaipurense]KAI93223.1 hypothetical protein T281_18010 [Rhodomicrobium udaipurense JA643]MBJ7543226.1 hypothetical protein [Rhodomicrobium udaipurense]